jgi:hypothetical protein
LLTPTLQEKGRRQGCVRSPLASSQTSSAKIALANQKLKISSIFSRESSHESVYDFFKMEQAKKRRGVGDPAGPFGRRLQASQRGSSFEFCAGAGWSAAKLLRRFSQ